VKEITSYMNTQIKASYSQCLFELLTISSSAKS